MSVNEPSTFRLTVDMNKISKSAASVVTLRKACIAKPTGFFTHAGRRFKTPAPNNAARFNFVDAISQSIFRNLFPERICSESEMNQRCSIKGGQRKGATTIV
jgi:hypothetical protein